MNANMRLDNLNKKKFDFIRVLKKLLLKNVVVVSFIITALIGFKLSGLSVVFLCTDIISRITRNYILILALMIPVVAGMGMNFAIVLGSIAAQIAIIMVTHWGITGFPGFLLCAILSTPLAIFLGFLTGKLFNKTKGREMITGLILGFFASGVYNLIFIILAGTVIPIKNKELILSQGSGVRNTIDLYRIKYAINNILEWSLPLTVIILATLALIIIMIYVIYNYSRAKNYNSKRNEKQDLTLYKFIKENTGQKLMLYSIIAVVAIAWGIVIMKSNSGINFIKVPIITLLCITAICLFNLFILKTKIGQDFRAVGQNANIAKVAGIDVNKIRVTAIIISTVIAAWGQLFFLQNVGILITYGSHKQTGMFSIAALLVGGASIKKATVNQALLGGFLFHILFIVSPLAGRNLFGDAQIGEYFRASIVYGVIGLALAMHAWERMRK